MDKTELRAAILEALDGRYQGAIDAARRAHQTATDDENVADNKYDTLGLEASYLAQGQAERVTQCERDLAAFRLMDTHSFNVDTPIAVGALVELVDLVDDECDPQWLFLGPRAGGLALTQNGIAITLITPSAPIGRALMGCHVDDEIEITVAGARKVYAIASVD